MRLAAALHSLLGWLSQLIILIIICGFWSSFSPVADLWCGNFPFFLWSLNVSWQGGHIALSHTSPPNENPSWGIIAAILLSPSFSLSIAVAVSCLSFFSLEKKSAAMFSHPSSCSIEKQRDCRAKAHLISLEFSALYFCSQQSGAWSVIKVNFLPYG